MSALRLQKTSAAVTQSSVKGDQIQLYVYTVNELHAFYSGFLDYQFSSGVININKPNA